MPDLALPENAALVPHLDQYFGSWMIHEETFRGIVESLSAIDLNDHIRAERDRLQAAAKDGKKTASASYSVVDGVAIFECRGTMTKYGSSLSSAPSTLQLKKDVLAAGRNPDVKSLLMIFDSPGGSTAGTHDLADAIGAVAKKKEVICYAEDMMASAAYFAASQATKIYASSSALVGSIGVYMVVQDQSAAAAVRGIKVHVVKSGPMKGAGVPGTEVTPEQLAAFQQTVDGLNEAFVASVASGRRLPIDKARALADGRTHVAPQALAMGLIDGVRSLDQVMAECGKSKKGPQMSENTAPVAATILELEAALPKADSDFLVKQLKAGATVASATSAWAKELEAKLETAQAAEAAATAKAAQLEAAANTNPAPPSSVKKPGAPALPATSASDDAESAGTATEQWEALVAKHKASGLSQPDAIRQAAVENPDLREQMNAEFTAAHPSLLAGKKKRAS